jgi:IclR family acetate operon transcriptional repressor
MQSVERIFLMLNTLAAHPDGLSLSEISEAVGLAKSTTSRFLQSLEHVQAIKRSDNSFSLGLGILKLATYVPNSTLIQAIAYPTLLELADKSRETVHLAIREGFKLTYIEQIDTPHHVQLQTWLNQTYPLHVTAAGKVFLAYASQGFINSYLARTLESYTPHSLSHPEALQKNLELIRQRAYAQTLQEFSADINGFAVGIFDVSGDVVAAISISGPSFRFPEHHEQAIIELLLEASEQLSQKIKKEAKVDTRA